MSSPGFVCPHNSALLDGMEGQSLAVRAADLSAVAAAAADAAKHGNRLVCVILPLDGAFDGRGLGAEHEAIPLAVFAPELAAFRDLHPSLDTLRKLNLRVYLPAERPGSLTPLRTLSSLGIPCALNFNGTSPDWEAMTDLATYALLGLCPHASIGPFAAIAEGYNPAGPTEWGHTFFDDPAKYLHLDERGRVALSHADLIGGRFVVDDWRRLDGSQVRAALDERTKARQRFFLDGHECSECEGWRMCLGRFSTCGGAASGCRGFFTELLDVVERRRTCGERQKERVPWQP